MVPRPVKHCANPLKSLGSHFPWSAFQHQYVSGSRNPRAEKILHGKSIIVGARQKISAAGADQLALSPDQLLRTIRTVFASRSVRGAAVASLTFIESLFSILELTIHLRESHPQGEYRAVTAVHYAGETPLHRVETAFAVPSRPDVHSGSEAIKSTPNL